MEKDIGKIPKNDMSDIVIRVDDFGGRRGLTIREFITTERYTGFTKSGVKIPAAEFKKFKEMVNSVSEEEMAQEPEESQEVPKNQETLDKKSENKKSESEELPDY